MGLAVLGWAVLCYAVLSRSRAALELNRESRKEKRTQRTDQSERKNSKEKKSEWKGMP